MFGGLILLMMCFVIYMVRNNIKSVENIERSRIDSYMRILTNYIQIIVLIYSFDL